MGGKNHFMHAYLEAGLEARAFAIAGVRGEPFINDDQPVTCPATVRGI